MSWHKPVRVAVGVFGVASLVVVYFGISARQTAAPPAAMERLDPKAILESTGAILQQVRKGEEDFEVRADRTLNYEDGSARMLGVRVSVKKRNGRDFVVTAKEAGAGKDRKDLHLTGDVVLEASDGFRLTTDDATYADEAGVVRAPGKVAFTKGGMSGSGVGMSYDKNTDVLTLLAESDVTVTPADGSAGTSFTAGSAVLDRTMDVLSLSDNAHATRGEQVFEASTITAHLDADEQFVRVIELRGQARVAGGDSTLDSMSAEAIDLTYVENGGPLDRVTLSGKASAALTTKGEQPGRRQLLGGVLEMQLGSDGSLLHAAGRDGIRFDLPVTERARGSSIQARTFDAKGEPGAGLTSAAFVDDVIYQEEATKNAAGRAARSRTLDVTMKQDEVSAATFKGSVAFEERGLTACAATVEYDPQGGAITLSGTDAGGGPRAANAQVAVAATAIDITLEGPRMSARGDAKTVLKPPPDARGNCTVRGRGRGAAPAATEEKPNRLPGLLKENAPVNVNADSLTYAGGGGVATYSGNAMLWQGETAIRADEVRLDQAKGDLIATGGARSTLMLDGKASIGRAETMKYEDARRLVTYESPRPVPVARGRAAARAGGAAPGSVQTPAPPVATPVVPGAPARAAMAPGRGVVPPPMPAFLSGPQGELRAWRIEMVLAAGAGRADRLEAYDDVNLRVEMRRATGVRLTYFAEDERYVMTGTATSPVCVVDPTRATTGKTLVFYRSADRILVDGNEETRTQTTSGGLCASSPVR
jgi:LPS export ABC transporter protein LptC